MDEMDDFDFSLYLERLEIEDEYKIRGCQSVGAFHQIGGNTEISE